MVSDTAIMLLAVVALAGGAYLATRRPGTIRPIFQFVESIRLVIGLVFIVLFAWFALSSGVGYMIVAALFLLAFVGAYIGFERPFDEVI